MEAKITFLPYRIKKQAYFLLYKVKNRLKNRLCKVKRLNLTTYILFFSL